MCCIWITYIQGWDIFLYPCCVNSIYWMIHGFWVTSPASVIHDFLIWFAKNTNYTSQNCLVHLQLMNRLHLSETNMWTKIAKTKQKKNKQKNKKQNPISCNTRFREIKGENRKMDEFYIIDFSGIFTLYVSCVQPNLVCICIRPCQWFIRLYCSSHWDSKARISRATKILYLSI
jgi:hypothetical protein